MFEFIFEHKIFRQLICNGEILVWGASVHCIANILRDQLGGNSKLR